ncbi:DUF4158 domain-containing protein [Streptomyces californicus]|uniref:DUF4158 domain-containing protein n=1 Tax=Streptomyces californicus TaxID=67351 RepID=UPI0038281988
MPSALRPRAAPCEDGTLQPDAAPLLGWSRPTNPVNLRTGEGRAGGEETWRYLKIGSREVRTLLEEDQERLRNKSGANRLGFALLLKFFEVEARFPEDAGEIPVPEVSYVAQQVKAAEAWAAYDWSGRAIKRHRMETRGAFGFRAHDEVDVGEAVADLASAGHFAGPARVPLGAQAA